MSFSKALRLSKNCGHYARNNDKNSGNPMLKQVRDADLHLLRVFVAVAECGGFAAAQERLNVAASTISTQISNLEARLGFRLCDRGRSGFALTNQGEIVLTSTYKLLRDLGEFVSTIEATQEDLIGTVRVLMIDNLIDHACWQVSPALATLRRDNPHLRFEMTQMAPGRIETALVKREAEIGIGWFMSIMPSLACESLFVERHQIYCGAGHSLFERAPDDVAPEELEQTDWVTRAYEMPSSIPFANPVVTTATTNAMEAVACFILAGTHVGYLPEHLAARWVDAGRMRAIRPQDLFYELQMSLAARKDAMRDPRTRAVWQAMLEAHTA